MIVFHRTSNGPKIVEEGFRDGTGTYFTGEVHSGVWFSNWIPGEGDGAKGDYLLKMAIPDDVFIKYEWIEEDRPFRESCIPAAVVNGYGRPVLCDEYEDVDCIKADNERWAAAAEGVEDVPGGVTDGMG